MSNLKDMPVWKLKNEACRLHEIIETRKYIPKEISEYNAIIKELFKRGIGVYEVRSLRFRRIENA
jgi:hypothetical protein